MKLNMVAYLAKSGNVIEDIVNTNANPIYHSIDVSNLNAHLYLKQSPSTPEWSNLFSGADIPPESFAQRTVKGLLILEVEDRYLAFTFGHGRSLLNKSIDKSTLDKVALNTRSQSSKNTGVENFSFEFDHEIMKSITAIVDREDEELEIVSGKDSVAIYTEISFGTIGRLARRLIEAYRSDVYKENYPWAEYIMPETDPELKNILDSLLVTAINARQYDEFWMCAPELIDYTDFSGFRYSSRSNSPKYTELNLSSFIAGAGFRGDVSTSTMKSKKVYILNSEEMEIDSWSFFQCIGGELEYEGSKFILNDGVWYSVSDDFYLEVCSYFSQIPKSALTFPSYGGLKEGPYLRSICNNVDLVLLDQQWVRPRGVANNLEFCDLYSSCKAIIHVKKYGSSAVLNHLFAQAYQSIEMLVNSPEVIQQVNDHLIDTQVSLNFNGASQREHRIVLAIMHHRAGDLDIPFFAKVNLRHHCRKIRGMGFSVELSKIPIGGVVFNNELELKALLEEA